MHIYLRTQTRKKRKKSPWKTMHISVAHLTLASIVEPSNGFQSQIFIP